MLCAHIESLSIPNSFYEVPDNRKDFSENPEQDIGRLDDGRLALVILVKLMDYAQEQKVTKNISESEIKKKCLISEMLFLTMSEYFL